MSRADSKHKPNRQIFKSIHHQDIKAAEIITFCLILLCQSPGKERGEGCRAIPAGAAGTVLLSHCSSFTPCGTARPQLLFLRVGGNFRCAHLDELGWADEGKDPLSQQQCGCSGASRGLAQKMGRCVLAVAVRGCARCPALQDRFVAEELHGVE